MNFQLSVLYRQLQKCKAFLFDMDGVIYDSMPYHAHAWHKAMSDFGLTMTETDAYLFEGRRGVETINIIAKKQWRHTLSKEEINKIYKHKCAIFATFPFPKKINNTDNLMRELKHRNILIVVVTGSGQNTILNRICTDYEGLVTKELMVTSFDVKHGKPLPDPYLLGMKKACAQPEECIVVENAPIGIKAAKAAGCYTIGINTGPLPDEMLRQAGADIVVHSMKEIIELVKNAS